MSKNFKVMFVLLFFSSTVAKLNAQTEQTQNKTTFSVETDPSTFAFGGYAFHVRVKPKNSQHLLLGAGTYALDLPDVMVNLNADNKNKGWKTRINSAYSFFGEYYFDKTNHKWFAGIQVGVQNNKIKNDHFANQEATYSNLLIMPSLGYTWHPFKFPFYLKPWLGLGYTSKISGENELGGSEYKIAPLVPFVTMHAGYTF